MNLGRTPILLKKRRHKLLELLAFEEVFFDRIDMMNRIKSRADIM